MRARPTKFAIYIYLIKNIARLPLEELFQNVSGIFSRPCDWKNSSATFA